VLLNRRKRWLVGACLPALAGCSLFADLSQFDGYTLAVPDGGGGPSLDATTADTSDVASTSDVGNENLPLEAGADEDLGSDATGNAFDASLDAQDANAPEEGDANTSDEGDGNTSGDAMVADASDACGIVPPNLLANAGFECGMTPWTGFADIPLQIVSTPVHSGHYACLVGLRSQTYDGPLQAVVAEAGAAYQGSAWVMTGSLDTLEAGTSVVPVYMTATFNCADPWDAGEIYIRVATGTATATGWTQIIGSMTLPAQCTPLTSAIYLEGPPPGIDLYVDDVTFSP
jgi:hypothetical protein